MKVAVDKIMIRYSSPVRVMLINRGNPFKSILVVENKLYRISVADSRYMNRCINKCSFVDINDDGKHYCTVDDNDTYKFLCGTVRMEFKLGSKSVIFIPLNLNKIPGMSLFEHKLYSKIISI